MNNTGQHRRKGEPLKQRIVKLMTPSSGSHRRRKATLATAPFAAAESTYGSGNAQSGAAA